MNTADQNVKQTGMARSTVVLIVLAVLIVIAAISFFALSYLLFGSVDRLFEALIQAVLQKRYDAIVAGQPIWAWSFWIFFWGFIALLVLVLLVVLYLTLLERKLIGWFQIRLGPNRVGPWGLLQPFADMIKLLIKEDIVPHAADKALHLIAPLIIFIPTLMAFVAIPFGAGTVELPQEIVAPAFGATWYEWLDAETAVDLGFDSPGFLEASVAIEENEEFHKTRWIPYELDHEPGFLPADEDGYILDERYRNIYLLTLPIKPENASAEPIYKVFYNITDFSTSGRAYDILRIQYEGSYGHEGTFELGLDGLKIDKVEADFADVVSRIGEEVPPETAFVFDRAPKFYFEDLFGRFTDAVAINTRSFGAESMAPAFAREESSRTSWRDIYTPDWNHVCYVHGTVSRDDSKARLLFFPARGNEEINPETEYDLETLDWGTAGGAFSLSRITGGGYTIEMPDGTVQNLLETGDSVDVMIGDERATVSLNDKQFYTVYIMGADLGIGIIYILAITSLTVLGIFMAGFGSNNKWSMYGAIRSAAQLISYEIPMTLAVIGPVIMSGTLSMVAIVENQRILWYAIPQFLSFYVFLICMTAEVNRSPFDLPEAESELVAGFHTEYSGLKFGFFYLAEYANMFLAAAIMSILFFGGWRPLFGLHVPFVGEFISSFLWFIVKCGFWLCVFIWFRATFPRFRIDQMMDYAWKVLLPLAMVNIILTGWFVYSDVFATGNWTVWRENNWRIWENYVVSLFTNVYTNYYAVPIIIIVAILLLTDVYGRYNDLKREAKQKLETGE
jgi:NADH-quinone oxidoreductase subunit H